MMLKPETTTAAQTSATPSTALPLRKDEVVSTTFMLQTLLMLVLLLGGLSLALKWFTKRMPNGWASKLKTKTVKRIQIIESVRLSARTRVTLVELYGCKAAVTETPQGASLQFLPIHTLPTAAASTQQDTPAS